MDPSLDASLVAQSINYHGQQLQKTWEAERGEDDLSKIGVGGLDFAVYQSRHKHLTFQDRGKRLKLHQFIAKEANVLFDASITEETPSSSSLGADAPTPEDSEFFRHLICFYASYAPLVLQYHSNHISFLS